MVDVSHETGEQTEARLRRVLALADFSVLDEPFFFSEFALHEFPEMVSPNALALVRDDAVWSQLVPADGDNGEKFKIFRFHFPAGIDNSGFVGWLATHLKRRFGTGVFVICGQNSRRGGIFDYWGCPIELADEVVAEINRVRIAAQ